MKYINKILFFIFIISSINGFSQNSTGIFAEGKAYVYQVAFIKANGDTLTNEKLIMRGKNKEWQFQKNNHKLNINIFLIL